MTTSSDVLPLVALGGGVVVAALVARSRDASATNIAMGTHHDRVDLGVQTSQQPVWVFPVPSLGDRHAVISDGFGSPRTRADGSKEKHLGADLMYRRRDARDLIAVYPPRTTNGTKGYFMPDGVPALAASAGVVRFAARTPVGHTVIIQHPSGWATYYTHLSSLTVARGEHVVAGKALGTIGASPTDHQRIAHLHLELWQHGTRTGAVDPAPHLAAWSRVVIAEWTPGAASTIAPRNAGLVYRPVGASGEPYPEWLRRAQGASGIYVIRERGGPIVYVGQSSSNKLYETVTRHLQRWRRFKGFWRGQFAEGHDPGLTYERDRVDVAIKITSPSEALDEEARLIRRLRPRDNILGQPELEDAPF